MWRAAVGRRPSATATSGHHRPDPSRQRRDKLPAAATAFGTPLSHVEHDVDVPDTEEPIDDDFLIGGPERREVVLTPYDPSWPTRYEAQQQRLLAALGAKARRIEHIGSTAVPGLVAKPVLDVLLVVDDVQDEGSYLELLEADGYVLRVREPGHRMLRTPDLGVHVHIWSQGDPSVDAHLAFRDQLRMSQDDRDRYAATKRELAARHWPTINHYAAAKTTVIREILNRSGSESCRAPVDPSR